MVEDLKPIDSRYLVCMKLEYFDLMILIVGFEMSALMSTGWRVVVPAVGKWFGRHLRGQIRHSFGDPPLEPQHQTGNGEITFLMVLIVRKYNTPKMLEFTLFVVINVGYYF